MYEIKKATIHESGENLFYFVLKAKNGKVICISEMYKSKQKCKKGIRSVVKNAKSGIRDTTKKYSKIMYEIKNRPQKALK